MKEYVLEPESARIFVDFQEYFKEFPSVSTIQSADYFAWSRTKRHATEAPVWQKSYEDQIQEILAQPVPSEAIVNRFVELDYASQIGGIVDAVIEGKANRSLTDIAPLIASLGKSITTTTDIVTDDLSDLVQDTIKTGGVEWRLEDLNRAVGPLRRGDFVIVGKRPEAGGTSFVCSEMTYMVPQLPTGVSGVFFNNEEVGRKIGLRLYQTGLGATSHDLSTNPAAHQTAYQKLLDGRRIDVIHRPGMTKDFVERTLQAGNYGVIAFNTLAKIDGFGKLEGADRMQAVGQWAREIADRYGVVIAVHQADATAEGQEWLDQSQLYGSKTGLQGESDVQIMIGKSSNPAKGDRRFLSVVRNKIPGGPRTDPLLKYYRGETEFDWQTGRFKSLSFKEKP